MDVKPCDVIEATVPQELSLMEQKVHSETDVRVAHLSPAFSYNVSVIESVMHHHQNCWFISRHAVQGLADVRSNSRNSRTDDQNIVTYCRRIHRNMANAFKLVNQA